MTPLISVIIPVYNSEQYLPACLESVCSQTLRDIEIICVDDGSTDGSPAILKQFAERDDRIHVITQTNEGELAARHTGIMAATGRWLGFVDSDDSVGADMFEHLLQNGERYQADISHCGMLFIYPDGHEVPHFGSGIIKEQDHDAALLDLLTGTQVEPSMCCKLYRRELFEGFNLRKRILHNGDLYSNFLLFDKSGSAVYEDFCGYHYFQRHAASQSVQTLMGILSVRHDLIGMGSAVIREAAYRLWLSTLVNTLNQLSVRKEKDAAEAYAVCRGNLRYEADKISVLSKKQQIAAKLHLNFPRLSALIYSVYGRISLYRYEH